MNKLAIVIPAYKATYLDAALDSICNQTNLNFNLYIGDDNSPENLEKIIARYSDKVNLTYVKFSENLGGHNLVNQWNRCLKMTKDESWIWLFSDDDIMDKRCVEYFYNAVLKENKPDIFRFNIKVINHDNKIIDDTISFPKVLNADDFLTLKLSGKIKSYVVEYIFRKTKEFQFVNFPIAWYSDVATIMISAKENSIHTIDNGFVAWRRSDINISPNYRDKNIFDQKIKASYDFLKWVMMNDFNKNNLGNTIVLLIRSVTYEYANYKNISIREAWKSIMLFIDYSIHNSAVKISYTTKIYLFIYLIYIRNFKVK